MHHDNNGIWSELSDHSIIKVIHNSTSAARRSVGHLILKRTKRIQGHHSYGCEAQNYRSKNSSGLPPMITKQLIRYIV